MKKSPHLGNYLGSRSFACLHWVQYLAQTWQEMVHATLLCHPFQGQAWPYVQVGKQNERPQLALHQGFPYSHGQAVCACDPLTVRCPEAATLYANESIWLNSYRITVELPQKGLLDHVT